MKKLFLVFPILLYITACTSYKEFVTVRPMSNIPNGTQSIVLKENLETVKKAFENKGIMLKSFEGGFETEEILLDEGTRAMYKAHVYGNQVKVTAFYGITQKVKSQMITWAGAGAASAYDVHAWDKVVYNAKEKRPKKVFDYLVQIIEENNLSYSFYNK